jgi:hypothetical protein
MDHFAGLDVAVVDSLKALDLERPIREADKRGRGWIVRTDTSPRRRYDVNEHRRYKPSVTSAQPRMVLLLRNSMTLGSTIAGRSCATTTVATMASQ